MAIYASLMGNPFVDAGISAICGWVGKEPEEITASDLERMTGEIAPIMCDPAWKKQLMIIFTINNPVTSPSRKGRDSEAQLRSVWKGYISTIDELGESGDCAGCGRRIGDHNLKKDGVPLTGSGSLRNFFPLFGEGVGYCSACALAIQFAPLAFFASGGRFLMIHSNSRRIQRVWARICIDDIRRQVTSNEITGCYNRRYSNPKNGLFFITDELMSRYESRRPSENVAIQVYHFSNENRAPELDIYFLPANVFRFLAYVHERQFQQPWKEIVRSGYTRVNWEKVQSEDDYKNYTNQVYERLIGGLSILGFFLDRSGRRARGNWELVTLYLREVRGMNETRLSTLKRIGDAIAETIRLSGNTRRLRNLEIAKSYRELRNVLRFIIKDRIAQGLENPLFSLDEYVEHIFPETEGDFTEWSETRDLIVFRIYEVLHKWLMDKKEEIAEDTAEDTEV